MINFLPEDQENLQKWNKARAIVMKVTTGVLAVYLLGAAGVLGWSVFLTNREGSVSQETRDLEKRLIGMANVEVLMRQLENRVEVVMRALATEKAADKLKLVNRPEVEVNAWVFTTEGNQTLTVSGDSSEELENYVGRLRQNYPGLEIMSVARRGSGAWIMNLVLK